MPKKEAKLLRMFDVLEAKDEVLVKGKWKRIPEEEIGVQLCRDDIGKYRRFHVQEMEEE
jgi:hypothetical protein